MLHHVAEKIAGALPGYNRLEVLRPSLRRTHPLTDRQIGNAVECDRPAAPGLHAGPIDQIGIVLRILFRVDACRTLRIVIAASVSHHDDVAVRHPKAGIRTFPRRRFGDVHRPNSIS